ncbi:hypothetical protein L1987_16080 [Smallanthus sonchifolius]|uniref:Uncharacterized protein n=1 Tax=Smallanthus sonchifolius TaxID=185202 RepID=A0ACB9J9G5_9ASTR|nr:hypothetical protein L1987_16080 [Smallanthus sonchifolius]
MRGTPGYLAPEWLSAVITEKVDVYSFGIVLLEMLCGRKNFDRSQLEESWHLLGVLQKCWEQGMLLDMVDKYSEDMQTHGSEVMEILKVASWCLQYDYTKRPSMSTVVKVLEGVMKVESRLDYNFMHPRQQNTPVEHDKDMTPLMSSVLSGPSCYSTTAQPPFDYPTANLSTTWANNASLPRSVNFTDGSWVRSILLRGSFGSTFACGFYCNGTCTSYLFSVFIVQTNSASGIAQPVIGFPQVVWSANRDHPASDGAILNLTSTGDLVLQDADGITVWTTNTAGKSIAGLNLTDDGNLVLFDVNSSVVWQYFDHPTDCLVPGQRLFVGQQLIPSVSSTNWTAQEDLFSFQVTDEGLFAYASSNPPQIYYSNLMYRNNTNTGRRYIRFLNGSLSLFTLSVEPSDPFEPIPIHKASSAQYMKLMPDGHLKVFEWQGRWIVTDDLLNSNLGECNYPMACGKNGLCSGNQQCSCPVSSSPRIDYFRAVNDR